MTDDVSVKSKGDLSNDLRAISQNVQKRSSFSIDSLLAEETKPRDRFVENSNKLHCVTKEKFRGLCDNNVEKDEGPLGNDSTPVSYNARAEAGKGSRCLSDSLLRRDQHHHQMDSELYRRSFSDGKKNQYLQVIPRYIVIIQGPAK